MENLNWDDLRLLLLVARTRSLSAAAVQLGVSPSTVGRRIALLERALGVTLFLPRRVRLVVASIEPLP